MKQYTISIEEFNNAPSGRFLSVRNLSSVEDVATLLETFELVLKDTNSDHIVDVVENEKRFYFFVTTSSKKDNSFDFYEFVNSKYGGKTEINPVNAKLAFPLSKSRGIYDTDFDEVEENTGSMEEDEATGFMDEEELERITSKEKFHLLYLKLNTKIPITPEGVIIGRSSKQAQYIISGNGNVSRKHARVFLSGGKPYIENYQPPNGTFVNGLRLPNGAVEPIDIGTEIILAGEEFKVV